MVNFQSAAIFGVLVSLVLLEVTKSQSVLQYNVLANVPVGPFRHVWEEGVCSCHAALSLRSDYQEQLREVHDDLGLKRIRFHGIFMDQMNVVQQNSSGLFYSFINVDRAYDAIVSIGMQPIVELSFMPSLLARGGKRFGFYQAYVDPPKDWNEWSKLVTAFTKHLIERYGLEEVLQWHFEVWNEANYGPFWGGTRDEYFKLYEVSYRALKAINPLISVGGPVTACSEWILEFIDYCEKNDIGYDFIATHEYPNDPPGPESRLFWSSIVKQARAQAGSDAQLFYTEFNDFYRMDTSYAAAFIAFNIYQVHDVVDLLAWWPFSDIYEEEGMKSDPFTGGRAQVAGLVNLYGIPKPSYRAFQLLHWSGSTLLKTTPDFLNHSTVGVFAVGGNHTHIYVVNWDILPATANMSTYLVNVTVTLPAPLPPRVRAVRYRLDDTTNTALDLWRALGSPLYLSPTQVALLRTASSMRSENVQLVPVGPSTWVFHIDSRPQSLNVIVIL